MARPGTPPDPLAASLLRYLHLRRWSDRRKYLRKHGELVSEQALAALAGQLGFNYAAGDLGAVVIIETAMTTLANAMSRGIDAATSPPPGCGDRELIPALLAIRLADLDSARQLARRSADPRFLHEAVTLSRSVAQLARGQIPYLQARALGDCGEIIYRLYQATGAASALAEAQACFQDALAASHPSSPDLPVVHNSLGIALRARAALGGDQKDLDAAVAHFSAAASGAEQRGDARNHRIFLASLGNAELDRFAMTGEIARIDDAVSRYQDALSRYASPDDDRADQRAACAGLGNALLQRFQFARRPDDLMAALAVQRRAATLSAGFADEAGYLINLAQVLDMAYRLTSEDELLDEAARVAGRALEGSAGLAMLGPLVRSGLADILTDRYEARRDVADLDEAVRRLREALADVPKAGARQPGVLENLARALALRSQSAAAQADDQQEATSAYRASCELALAVDPAVALTAGRSWGDWALSRQEFAEAAQAYRWASAAAHELFAAQQLRSHQENLLSQLQGMPEDRAYACARAGQLEEAVVALERDRAMLLSTALQLHDAYLDGLRAAGAGQLCDRYEACVRRLGMLAQAELRSRAGPAAGQDLPGDNLAEQRQARRELAEAIAALRADPGYAGEFDEPGFAEIAARADQPVVYLASSEHGGLAIILRGPQSQAPEAIWLDDLRTDAVTGQADRLFAAGRARHSPSWCADLLEHTQWLWSAAMSDVVAALAGGADAGGGGDGGGDGGGGGGGGAGSGALPQVTLVPCGPLALFPLHAASRPDPSAPTGRAYALDQLTISYAYGLSARGLPSRRPGADLAAGTRLVTVASAPGADPSAPPQAGADIAAAQAGFPGEVAELPATLSPDDLLAELARCSDLHIACHGLADLRQPTASRLVLSPGAELAVSDLLRFAATRRIPARLAVLSACETAIVGLPLIDEVIGLPAGFKQSGAEVVVASLWLVPDVATALLMYRFYDQIRARGQGAAAAMRAAQRWVRDARNADKDRALRDREDPRLRALWEAVRALPPDRREDAHPASWAAFTVIR